MKDSLVQQKQLTEMKNITNYRNPFYFQEPAGYTRTNLNKLT